jgi:preprotein translocase subunit SecD
MATEDGEAPTPIPRPMIVRVLAALAIAAILVLSMWYIIRAAHDVNKRVNDVQSSTSTVAKRNLRESLTLTPTRMLTSARMHSDALIVQRRARALGYTAQVTAVGRTITLGTNRAVSAPDRRTLLTTGTVDTRVDLEEMLVDLAPTTTGATGRAETCAHLVAGRSWLWGTEHKVCYRLGPSLLDGTAVVKAKTTYDPSAGGWGVDATYRGNEFVLKVAQPYAGKQVAFVFNGAVLTDPVIEQGIVGSQIRISGDFTEATARTLGAVLASGDLTDRFAIS